MTRITWPLCTGFETAAGTLWVNDSTNPDAVQEYAVLRTGGDTYRQVESITVGWVAPDRLRDLIEQVDRGAFDEGYNFGTVGSAQLDPEHHPSRHCA